MSRRKTWQPRMRRRVPLRRRAALRHPRHLHLHRRRATRLTHVRSQTKRARQHRSQAATPLSCQLQPWSPRPAEPTREHSLRETRPQMRAPGKRCTSCGASRKSCSRGRRRSLAKASSVEESLRALKRWNVADFGQGHEKGGTRAHAANRREVLERLRRRAVPLPPDLANDWDYFVRSWDTRRVMALYHFFRSQRGGRGS